MLAKFWKWGAKVKSVDPLKIKIHFIGIGGTSMSGLAISLTWAFKSPAPDMRPCAYTDKFESEGYSIARGIVLKTFPMTVICGLYRCHSAIPKWWKPPISYRLCNVRFWLFDNPLPRHHSRIRHPWKTTTLSISMMLLHTDLDQPSALEYHPRLTAISGWETRLFHDQTVNTLTALYSHQIAVILNVEDHLITQGNWADPCLLLKFT